MLLHSNLLARVDKLTAQIAPRESVESPKNTKIKRRWNSRTMSEYVHEARNPTKLELYVTDDEETTEDSFEVEFEARRKVAQTRAEMAEWAQMQKDHNQLLDNAEMGSTQSSDFEDSFKYEERQDVNGLWCAIPFFNCGIDVFLNVRRRYNRQDFVDYYGGTEEWESVERLR